MFSERSRVASGHRSYGNFDKENTRLFMKFIPKSWSVDHLENVLKTFVSVQSVLLPREPGSTSNRGFAFLTFATHTQAKQALERLSRPDVVIGVRSPRVMWSDPYPAENFFQSEPPQDVQIRGLLPETSDAEIRQLAETVGPVERIMRGQNRAFAFVTYGIPSDARRAVDSLQGKRLRGVLLELMLEPSRAMQRALPAHRAPPRFHESPGPYAAPPGYYPSDRPDRPPFTPRRRPTRSRSRSPRKRARPVRPRSRTPSVRPRSRGPSRPRSRTPSRPRSPYLAGRRGGNKEGPHTQSRDRAHTHRVRSEAHSARQDAHSRRHEPPRSAPEGAASDDTRSTKAATHASPDKRRRESPLCQPAAPPADKEAPALEEAAPPGVSPTPHVGAPAAPILSSSALALPGGPYEVSLLLVGPSGPRTVALTDPACVPVLQQALPPALLTTLALPLLQTLSALHSPATSGAALLQSSALLGGGAPLAHAPLAHAPSSAHTHTHTQPALHAGVRTYRGAPVSVSVSVPSGTASPSLAHADQPRASPAAQPHDPQLAGLALPSGSYSHTPSSTSASARSMPRGDTHTHTHAPASTSERRRYELPTAYSGAYSGSYAS